MGLGPRTNPLDFGSDPDADPDVMTLYPEMTLYSSRAGSHSMLAVTSLAAAAC